MLVTFHQFAVVLVGFIPKLEPTTILEEISIPMAKTNKIKCIENDRILQTKKMVEEFKSFGEQILPCQFGKLLLDLCYTCTKSKTVIF